MRKLKLKKCPLCPKMIWMKSKTCQSCWQKGEKNNVYKGTGILACVDCGKKTHYNKRCWECFKKWNRGENHYSWTGGKDKHKCIDCSVTLPGRSSRARRCWTCYKKWHRGSNHQDWKGGRYLGANGYVLLNINSHGVHEHRYVMEQKLGRKLLSTEIVHHLNGIRTDNRLENLMIVSRPDHEHNTIQKLLQARIRELESQLTAKQT